MQPQSLARGIGSDVTSVRVGLGDEFLAAGVDEEADEIGTHVVAAEIGDGFWDVGFVEVDLS